MKVYIESYGCTLNKADSKIIEGMALGRGSVIVHTPEDADIIFLNSCGVKLQTERKIIERIKKLDRLGPRLVVCGCLPKINLKEIRKASKCTLLDTNSFEKIPDILNGASGDFFSAKPEEKLSFPIAEQGAIAAIPISSGCLGSCTYCSVKNARGRLKSYSIPEIRQACEEAIARGAVELQLTSQDCGVYGVDTGDTLPGLVEEICSISGRFRIRVGMMNPKHAKQLLPSLIRMYSNEKVYRFAHIPVQSGSDKVLREMKRGHTAAEFMEIITVLRKNFPDMCISTDIIVGYPTETRQDFEMTLSLLESAKPDITNISKFYPRPGTEAASLKKIKTQELKQRSKKCSELCARISLEQNSRHIGSVLPCLATSEGRKGNIIARAPNYKQVIVENAEIGKECHVKILNAHMSYLSSLNEQMDRKQ